MSMQPLDTIAPNYLRPVAHWSNAASLSDSLDALVACHNSNSIDTVEHVKSYVETVCITILGDNGRKPSSSLPKLTDLLVEALEVLGYSNSRTGSKLDKLLSAFNRLSDAINEMRNDNGIVAHGKDGFWDTIDENHRRAFLFAGDSLLALLMNAVEGKSPNLLHTRLPHERFNRFNSRIDSVLTLSSAEAIQNEQRGQTEITLTLVNGVSGVQWELKLLPSWILFSADREVYVDALSTVAELETNQEGHIDLTSVLPLPTVFPIDTEELVDTSTQEQYDGRLLELAPILEHTLKGVLTSDELNGSILSTWTSSLLIILDEELGIDWRKRNDLQARLRVRVRRVLIDLGMSPARAKTFVQSVLPPILETEIVQGLDSED